VPDFPHEQDSEVQEHIPVASGHGKIRKLKIVLAKSPIPDSLRGIAIQRGGMTVCRHQLPYSIPEDVRERVHGFCMMDSRLDEEMWGIELANHEGFEARKPVWVDLRRKIDSLANEFLSEHIKEKRETLPIQINQIVETVNKLVEEHLTGSGLGKTGPSSPGALGKPLPPVYISPWGYLGSSKRFDAKDSMDIKGAIGNKTNTPATVDLKVRIEHSSGSRAFWFHDRSDINVHPKSKRTLNIPLVNFSALRISKGKYTLRAEIRDKKKTLLHRRASVFYFERDPPPVGGGWLKKMLFGKLGGPKANLRNLPINSRGELLINLAYPEINVIWRSRKLGKKQKAADLTRIFVNVALHEAIREVSINWWKTPSIKYDIDEIKKAKDLFDEMWAAYIVGA
jgi:hypothetical protein